MPDFDFSKIPTDTLIEVCSRSLHTVDGLWFLAVEEKYGFDAAFELNRNVWQRCSLIHGKRILRNFAIKEDTPLQTLIKLIQADPLLFVQRPEVVTLTDTRAVLRFLECPTQVARIRDGRGVYPGKPTCTIFFKTYASLVDPSIKVTCLACAPNPGSPEYWCEWEFEISQNGDNEDTATGV
ncbi:DUF6125 family protein [Chloroflexota bacterium]